MNVFRVAWRLGVLAWFALPACGGGEEAGGARCDDHLVIRLHAGDEGWYVLDGAADGEAFRCSYYYEVEGLGGDPEDVYFGGACTGTARFVEDWLIEIDGTPASVAWTAVRGPSFESGLDRRSGLLEPEYTNRGACRTAEADLRPW